MRYFWTFSCAQKWEFLFSAADQMVLTHSISHKAKMIFTLRTKPWNHKSLWNISCWRICEQSFVPLHLASFLLLINAFTVKNLFLLTATHMQFIYLFPCQKILQKAPKCCSSFHMKAVIYTMFSNSISHCVSWCSRGRVKQKYLSFFHATSSSFYKYRYCTQNKSTPVTNLRSKKSLNSETRTLMICGNF